MLSGGRLVLGVGAGWLAEEFDALDVPFASRGRRFIEWLRFLGVLDRRAGLFDGEHYVLPAGVVAAPAPGHDIPVLVGGDSPTALSRAATSGDGWLAHQSAAALDFGAVQVGVENAPERQACRPSLGGTVDHCSHYRFF